MKKLVSIIIPVYNAADYLAENIASILSQDYENLELILVDDGSKDSSAEIMKKYQTEDSRVMALFQENSGAPTARNYGLSVAEGDYIQFIDSDDYMADGALTKMVTALDEGKADMVIGSYDTVDENDFFIKQVKMPFQPGNYDVSKNRDSLSLLPPMPGNKLFRARVIRDNNLKFEPSLRQAQDLNFYLKMLLFVDRVAVLDDITYHYRVRSGSISHTYSLVILEVIKSINNVQEFYATHGFVDEKLFMSLKLHHYTFQIQKIPQIATYADREKAIQAFRNEFRTIKSGHLTEQNQKRKYFINKLKLALKPFYISGYYAAYQNKKAKKNKIS